MQFIKYPTTKSKKKMDTTKSLQLFKEFPFTCLRDRDSVVTAWLYFEKGILNVHIKLYMLMTNFQEIVNMEEGIPSLNNTICLFFGCNVTDTLLQRCLCGCQMSSLLVLQSRKSTQHQLCSRPSSCVWHISL